MRDDACAALFDFDGTIADTEPQYTLFWAAEGRRYHPEIPDFAHVIKGQTLVQIYDRYFSHIPEEQPLITRRLDEYERMMRYEYIGGFLPFFRRLSAAGVRTAIVTSSDRKKMANVYAAHPELRGLTDVTLTSEDFTRSKPDPECFLLAARRLGVAPERCVGFEDSINGLRSVRAAGMRVVGMATTLPRDTVESLADIVADDFSSPAELLGLFGINP